MKIRWDARVIATPLMGKATSSLYDIVCPTSGTIGTGQIADADGIPLGANSDNLATLYYVLPTASANTKFIGNFRVITSANTTDNLDSRWMALATLNTDANPTLKWHRVRSPCLSLTVGNRYSGAATCSSWGGAPKKSHWMVGPGVPTSLAP